MIKVIELNYRSMFFFDEITSQKASRFCEIMIIIFFETLAYETRSLNLKHLIGTSVLNPGAGFLRIFTVAFDRLF